METPKIFDSELRFCEILWEHQPVRSSELAHLCAEKLGWKKSTTYTVIKRLTERGVVQTEDAVVTALVSRDQVQRAESRAFVEPEFQRQSARLSQRVRGRARIVGRRRQTSAADDRRS